LQDATLDRLLNELSIECVGRTRRQEITMKLKTA